MDMSNLRSPGPLRITDLMEPHALQLIEQGLAARLGAAVALMQLGNDGKDPEYCFEESGRWGRCEFCEYLRSLPNGDALCLKQDRLVFRALCSSDETTDPIHACHECYMGLIDIAVPILVRNKVVAVMLSGQKRLLGASDDIVRRIMLQRRELPGVDIHRLRAAIDDIPEVSQDDLVTQAEAVIHAAKAIADIAETRAELVVEYQNRLQFMTETIHEYRASLQAMLSESEFLLDYMEDIQLVLPAEVDKSIRRITSEVIRTTHGSILTALSQTDAAGSAKAADYDFSTEHSLRALLADLMVAYRHVAGARGIVLREPEWRAKDDTFVFDYDGIRTVLVNLLDNAIKYSHRNTYILIGVTRVDQEMRVSVEDMGVGIPAGELEAIFEPFRRVQVVDTSRIIWGAGLGLSVAKHVVEAHGGRIWAKSERGRRDAADQSLQGYRTSVTFTLPFRRRERE